MNDMIKNDMITPFSELCTQWEMTYKYIWYMIDKDFTIKYINRNCAPRRRAGSLAGEKPVCEGLTNQQ